MLKRIAQATLGAALLGGTLYAGTHRFGAIPPLAPLLDPANGIWSVARGAAPWQDRQIAAPIFSDSVHVTVDDRGVPHIFAADELDGYRALGFMVAKDRLFQLELQTRAAQGTLTELLGSAALPLDRDARKLGFAQMFDRTRSARDTTTPAYRSIVAYAEGINQYIEQMKGPDLPLEYRLLGARPAKWTIDQTYALLARMAVVLAMNDPSLLKARAAALVGWPAAEALFPNAAPIQDPIQPNTVDSVRYGLLRLPPPGLPDARALGFTSVFQSLMATGAVRPADPHRHDALGSNNWAVAPARTEAKQALLAGDPHLELTLPSIWYQAHLVVADKLDVSGVTLPGAPWVIIGFNRSIAWSFTNVGSDVNDFYRETVDDREAPTRYQLDGAWRQLEQRVERYRNPAGDVLAVDTIRFTHRGPLWRTDSSWVSMAWTAYDPTDHGREFLAIDRARTAGEFLEGSASYPAPAQNMIVADRRGTIAIRSTGRYPIRPGDGRGDLIKDGSLSANDWNGSLPVDSYPFAINPSRGFLSSANQQPIDPTVNPRYLGGNWESPWRGIRINRLLRNDSTVTPDEMRRFQTDPGSERARAFLPILLGAGTDSARRNGLPAAAKAARALLAEWDGAYTKENQRAVLFEATMDEVSHRTWDELAGSTTKDRVVPSEIALLQLVQDTASIWWDDRSTVAVERRDDIIAAALSAALDSTTRRYGDPAGGGWRWSTVHRLDIHHLLRLPALSALGLEVAGGRATLSPSGDGYGPSWRMVVELGNSVRAWATYPGGQSGNLTSRHYLDLLPKWVAGDLDSLLVPLGPGSLPPDRVESRLVFVPGR